MDPVGKALWLIESRFAQAISLSAVADASGVSRFHLSRAFGAATGRTVMGYLRSRRLAVAARALSGGALDILTVALEAGYGSHEAFSRAFRNHFGLTPEQVRAQGHLENLELLEPIRMDHNLLVELEAPRMEDGQALLIAGLGGRYTFETNEGIPAQWQRFGPFIGNIPGQVGWTTYGVCCNSDDAGSFEYICGVKVSDFSDISTELSRIRIPAHRYVVFTHRGHISTIRSTVYTIWNKYLPEAGLEVADAPDFERYDERFDPESGSGEVEIWIPIN
ncbi:AraC family transcriptional regulator [Pseudaminobacter sp. 19-2017]|uniref:AraC family transcriptional regulator n=1 Tax=Pseudaminobacter soli (ex Zhang et al. 2022) TaxID=2831468 RepID=A0A942E692_9HYPH|nr:AraC family transcriptional regulator [Pseudaminobacter soli]MBS3651716.1 AraC family transcriptional regulator [Pseudaminobacter soli]